MSNGAEREPEPWGDTVLVEFEEDGVAVVTLNRPEKRNAMNPTLNREMSARWSTSRSTIAAPSSC